MYDEVLRVPFFMAGPGLTPKRITTPVETLDILPTVAALLDLPKNPTWQGRDLFNPERPHHPPRFLPQRAPPGRASTSTLIRSPSPTTNSSSTTRNEATNSMTLARTQRKTRISPPYPPLPAHNFRTCSKHTPTKTMSIAVTSCPPLKPNSIPNPSNNSIPSATQDPPTRAIEKPGMTLTNATPGTNPDS